MDSAPSSLPEPATPSPVKKAALGIAASIAFVVVGFGVSLAFAGLIRFFG